MAHDANNLAAARETVREVMRHVGLLYRHKKTGGVYLVTGVCVSEATLEACVLYGCVSERQTQPVFSWSRPAAEFLDGRFERVTEG